MSTEAGVASMGRILTHSALVAAIYTAVIALAYGAVIAAAIYRLSLGIGMLAGAAMAIPLYGFNYMFVRALSEAPSNEIHVVLAHILFCLTFSAQYRAMAVPTVDELEHHAQRHHHAR